MRAVTTKEEATAVRVKAMMKAETTSSKATTLARVKTTKAMMRAATT